MMKLTAAQTVYLAKLATAKPGEHVRATGAFRARLREAGFIKLENGRDVLVER